MTLPSLVIDAMEDLRRLAAASVPLRRKGLTPSGFRSALSDLWCAQRRASASHSLVLLFGSAARCEPSQDLDLLMVLSESMTRRIYERSWASGWAADLNVAGADWLQTAGRDVEWGYCLSEGFVLGQSAPALEGQWRQQLRIYQEPAARERRRVEHLDWSSDLERAARLARPLTARLLGHEAVRHLCFSFMHALATRVFSHRSFVGELTQAWGNVRTGESLACRDVVRGLVQRPGHENDAEAYVALRGHLSSVYRSLTARVSVPYDPGATIGERVRSLCSIPAHSAANAVESYLRALGLDRRLPHCDAVDRIVALRPVLRAGHFENVRSVRVRRRADAVEVPRLDAGPGSRWRQRVGGRLKVILATGGCRTPSCRFCALPRYGQTRGHGQGPAETLRSALSVGVPHTLALYNDGSLLNPAELPIESLLRLMEVVKAHSVARLEIESIPRFVTSDALALVRETSGVRELQVAMGLQCSDETVARWLGRPDPTALFDRAISVLHEAGARSRIYLLWGYPEVPLSEWRVLLTKSLIWAMQRGADAVTICPWVAPTATASGLPRGLCALRETLAAMPVPVTVPVDVSLPEEPTCGLAVASQDCGECVSALRAGSWGGAAACSEVSGNHGVHR